MFLGLRTTIHPAPDLAASTDWSSTVLGVDPYLDVLFYVGFAVAGYELGLDPNQDPAEGAGTYQGVGDVHAALARLLETGETPHGGVHEVGGGVRVATCANRAAPCWASSRTPPPRSPTSR